MIRQEKKFLKASSLLLSLGLILLLATDIQASPGATLYTQGGSVKVYQAPGADAPIVAQLDRGQKLKEFRRQGSWVKVIIYGEVGKEGWVRSSDVRREDPGAGTVKTTESEVKPAEVSPGPVETEWQPDTGPPFILVMEGVAVGFRATCTIINHSGSKTRRKLVASVPKAYSFDAAAVSCSVRNAGRAGRLMVKLRKKGRLIAAYSTRVSYGYVQVRSKGPWGKAYSRKCDRLKRVCIRRTRPTLF